MSKRSAWLCEYEQLCNSATSTEELQNLSVQYISRQREDLLSQIERYKAETEQSHAEGERSHAELEKLRDVLKRLRTELEVRAPRFARTDHEDLRAIVSSGLRQTSCEASVAEGSSGNIMKRLRARVEQLERANKRLEKECDTVKLQKLVAQRDLQRAGLEPGKIRSTSATGAGLQQQRSPRNSTRSLIDDSHGIMPSPRATASSPPRGRRSMISAGEEVETKAPPNDERERSWTGEREHLLAMMQHMEKEQVEQQQYADQVMNQLGHALRALEADNASLQEESKQHCQKFGASVEARRKLDRVVKQLRAEKEALSRQVISLRSGPHSDSKAPGHSRHLRSPRSKSPTAVCTGSSVDKVAGRTVGNGVVVADHTVKVSHATHKLEEKLEDEAEGWQQEDRQRRSDSVEMILKGIQDLAVAVEVSPPSDTVGGSPPQRSRGLAWRSFESDGTLEDSPSSPHLTPFTSSSTLAEVGAVAEALFRQATAMLESSDAPGRTSAKDDLVLVAEEPTRETPVLRVEHESKDRVTQPATPAWAVISVSPTEMLPRVSSPGRVDVKPRPGRASSPPKRPANGSGVSATNPVRVGGSRSPRTAHGVG